MAVHVAPPSGFPLFLRLVSFRVLRRLPYSLIALLLSGPLLPGALPATGADRDAESVLKAHGLRRGNSRRIWELPQESRLRRYLKRMPGLRSQILERQRQLVELVRQNRQRYQAAQLRAEDRRSETSPGERKRNKKLPPGVVPPDRISQRPDIRRRIRQLNELRNALALSILCAPPAQQRLLSDYNRLQKEQAVVEALTALGHRLSNPRSYVAALRTREDFKAVVFTPWTPLFRENRAFRVAGILNDHVPVTFTWSEGKREILLTRNVAVAANLDLEKAAVGRVRLGNREYAGKRITLPVLRFGSSQLRNATAIILPPEAEHHGCQISRSVFRDFRVELQPDRLRMIIAPAVNRAEKVAADSSRPAPRRRP